MKCNNCGKEIIEKLAPSSVVLIQKDLIDIQKRISKLKSIEGIQSPAITREINNAVSMVEKGLGSLKKVQVLLK